MKLLEYAFRRTPMSKNDTTVQFISISIDPVHDSSKVLSEYAKSWDVDQNHWWFLAVSKTILDDWAQSQLHISARAHAQNDVQSIPTNEIVVLDRDRFIRGYYNGLDTASIGRCANDMGLLALEKKHLN